MRISRSCSREPRTLSRRRRGGGGGRPCAAKRVASPSAAGLWRQRTGASGVCVRGTASAPCRRRARRSRASARLRVCDRSSCATATTRGPERASRRARWASVSEAEASTSKIASTRDAVTFACWPPGPDERLVRSVTSERGIESSPLTRSAPGRPQARPSPALTSSLRMTRASPGPCPARPRASARPGPHTHPCRPRSGRWRPPGRRCGPCAVSPHRRAPCRPPPG